MIKITASSPTRIDIELAGQIDADDMRIALDELIDKSQNITQGRMFYRITDFALPTLGAMEVEMSRLPKLFGLLGKFDK
ncbi:MAG: STAS/SEC14 domain-containing protein [Erythrobacter sp.]